MNPGKDVMISGRDFWCAQYGLWSLSRRKPVLSGRKRNRFLYLPLVWDQQPLPVSFAVGDLKSLSAKEAVDHDGYVIAYKHTLIGISAEQADAQLVCIHTCKTARSIHLIEPDRLLLYTSSQWASAEVEGEGLKLSEGPEVCLSSGSHRPEKSFINTWPG